jgi:AbrB family looped-hinge helix DNA binding protein
MTIVTVSPKFQIVIPRPIRDSLGVRPGHKVRMILYQDRIELIPFKPIQETRGFLKGIDTTVEREPDRSWDNICVTRSPAIKPSKL